MAAGTMDRSAILVLLKDRYPFGSKIWDTFNTGAPLLDAIESGTGFPKLGEMTAEGQRLRIPLWLTGNPNAAVPISERGGYPRPGSQSYDEAIYNIGTFVQSFTLTGLARAVSRGGASSIVRTFDNEMAKQPINARQRLNRALHSDGSGLQATITTSGSASTGVLNVPTTTDMRRFAVGMELQIRELLDASTVYTGQSSLDVALVISAIDNAAFEITLQTEGGLAINFTLGASVPQDNTAGLYLFNTCGGANGTAFDMFGLEVMCGNANPVTWGQAQATAQYGEVDRTGTAGEFWRATHIDANGVGLSLVRHIQKISRLIDQKSGNDFGGRLLCPLQDVHYYSLANEMERDRRTGPEVVLKRGNWPMMRYNDIMFLKDYTAPATKARFISPRSTYRYLMTPWFWEDDTGSTLERETTSTGRPTNVFRMNMLSRQQLISTQCHTNGEINGLPNIA